MELIKEMAGALWGVWGEMWEIVVEVVPKVFKFTLWLICGIFILPCVYIAGVFFPMWTGWGEEL